MTYRYQHQFPSYFDFFPMVSKSTLITNAFQEAKIITQAPDPMVYLASISAASIALQGVINVELPIGKVCPVSLSTLTIAESGERKSSVENLLTKGIKLFQKQALKCYQEELKRYKAKLEIHNKKTVQIKKSVDLNNQAQCEDMVDILLEHERYQPVKPMLPMLTFEDSTQEALLSSLSENIPNAFLGSSEGGVLLNSRLMSQTASLNSIWSGDDITVNRKVEESYTLEGARLTVSIMTQWGALERFMKKTKDDIRGNGHLSRFLVCAPFSNCGFRQSNGMDSSRDGLQAFNDRLYELLSETAELDDYTLKRVIKFSDEAKRIWLDVYNDIESKMGPNGIYQDVKDHASKLPENIARVAALIHYFDNSSEEGISASTLMEAINLVGYFSSQFMSVFSAPPKYVTDSQNLMQWLSVYANSGIRYLKRNNILQFGPKGTRKKADLGAALDYIKLNNDLAEIIIRKTRVIDLWPQQPFDEAKLCQDLSLDVVF